MADDLSFAPPDVSGNDTIDDTHLIPYPNATKLVPQWEVIIKVVAYVVVIVVSLIGNSLIIYIVLNNRRMRTTTNYYMVNLAVADLMVTVSCSWVHLVDSLTEGWVLGYFFCKINSFCQVLSLVSSVFTLALIAYDRFFGIVFALKAHMTERRARWSLLFIWVSSVAVACPLLIYRQMFVWQWLDHDEVWCGDDWPKPLQTSQENNEIPTTDSSEYIQHSNVDTNDTVIVQQQSPVIQSRKFYYTFVSVVLYFIPVVIMILAYSVIIWRLRSTQAPGERSRHEAAVQAKVRRKVVIMLVILMLTFALCWLPYQISILYAEHRENPTAPMADWFERFQFFALFIAYSNSALNPVIYAFFNENFRQAFKELARNTGCTKPYRRVDGNIEMTSQTYTHTIVSRDVIANNCVTTAPKTNNGNNFAIYG